MYKKISSLFSLALLAFYLSGCGSIPFVSGEVRMSAEELTQKMARRFPMERSIAGLVDVTLANPRADFSESENRIFVSFQVVAKMSLGGKALTGNVRVSGRPEYMPDSLTLFLRDARVDQVRLDMTDAISAALGKTVSGLARDQLADRPLHIFRPEDFTRYGIQYVPERIIVRGDQLVLLLKR
jgi:hypothetical protein